MEASAILETNTERMRTPVGTVQTEFLFPSAYRVHIAAVVISLYLGQVGIRIFFTCSLKIPGIDFKTYIFVRVKASKKMEERKVFFFLNNLFCKMHFEYVNHNLRHTPRMHHLNFHSSVSLINSSVLVRLMYRFPHAYFIL